MASGNLSNLASALASLKQEEKDIESQIRALNQKREELNAAILHIGNLLDGGFGEGYTDLSLRAAIRKFLKEKGKPLPAPEIARGLLEAGVETKSENFVNLVGVMLRQNEGQQFKRDSENRWSVI